MNRLILINIARFILLVLIQELILDRIQVSIYVNPFLYILFILVFPFEAPKWLLLVSAFLLGLTVDLFSNTLGLNTIACVFIAWCRPGVLAVIAPRQEYAPGMRLSIADLGFKWFISYAAILIIIHHTILFILEVFSFTDLTITLSKIILSSVVTLFLCIISQYIMFREKK
jgi:rod shape-determining protein MreD